MDKLKIYVVRMCLRFFWLFSIDKNKIFLSSYEGKQFSCNPKYIYQYLQKKDIPFKYVYEYNLSNIPSELKRYNVQVVKHNSLAYIWQIMTSKVLITNSGISCCFPLRKSQININTWHGGGAYKKVGVSISEEMNGSDSNRLKISAKQTTFFVSSSKMFTDIMSESVLLDKSKFLDIGMPRNDIFFEQEKLKLINNRVRQELNIKEDDFIVLYAPTYRGNCGEDQENRIRFDAGRLKETVKKRYKKNVSILIRMHYFNNQSVDHQVCVKNVTDYPDMQELLAVADMLITDYSSSIWDYSFTKGVCHLYCYDFEEYDSERGFYSNIMQWPGILSKSEEELYRNIIMFDENEYKKQVKKHHEMLLSYEEGVSCEKIYDIIKSCYK